MKSVYSAVRNGSMKKTVWALALNDSKTLVKSSGETNFILRIKEHETRLILHKHDDYDDDDDDDDDENNQQDALYSLINYSKSALHVLGDVFAHHQKDLTVITVSGSVHLSCCRLVPAATWVNTTRYCKCSQVLLVMGENIAQNRSSRLGIINLTV
jgi:hypothetical protein